ncbi:hypothetical protein ACS5PU_16540 [Pedobacter sp. GSP4]|uniref:hypothetical protein n=1 Tax=Pedobacter sp. GSP4 TaxID=3453716 RepID=UPI003EEB80B6
MILTQTYPEQQRFFRIAQLSIKISRHPGKYPLTGFFLGKTYCSRVFNHTLANCLEPKAPYDPFCFGSSGTKKTNK